LIQSGQLPSRQRELLRVTANPFQLAPGRVRMSDRLKGDSLYPITPVRMFGTRE